ncbi:MAG TPA: chorismate synthase [Hungateiclostridium thermocellum]|jgi:chorismate synthase|uniref:Chorismate synthase n=2 Tax=Acetivibrio thermocellus TaxID=1515 RepID=AROC_ACET2|nr:chorismate synthase [Acetivibrio thermocellus]A3DDD8.1 RecName: Full=Chorismate synthase; Short=CS; AltName: Full=5-enolpyruvylshikimate-3-phosphate phospholyase [Acetivibrio thermocellus ATCC 27405]CDG35425.1 Chorismate synthase [Acetivibrio thermocellus BC1]ABN51967.1 chorismate synthase [Acetivibrio thermocellus ATCC 27405]ADU74553.1 chorismate synthase [Acetivibrio thermocellus DSM 1313]ALX08497.1 Chorismate synthase [Acetivibrio thermocellus AD2]ANV76246.1 Chorismate synthase [Acetivi
MVGNTFGRIFRVTTCGESYAGAFRKNLQIPKELFGGLIAIVDGVPPGIKLTADFVQEELDKRRPGKTPLDTPRKERDKVYIFSGVMEDDITTGAPVGMIIPNDVIEDEHINKHKSYKEVVRPGQAGYTFFKKYGQFADNIGAGRASGRETAARVAAGAVAKAVLDTMGIDVIAFVTEIHGIKAQENITYEMAKANYRKNEINCPDLEKAKEMIEELKRIKEEGDSVGGVVEIIARGVPAGLGEPVFDKLQATLAHALMSIGAIKGIEFGEGFGHTKLKGSESNDVPYYDEASGRVRFKTNRAGGILGGISNGEDIRIRVAVKPTPTISIPQKTVNMYTLENVEVEFNTRNDPSICPRIYPVCEAMVRIALLDALYIAKGYRAISSNIDPRWDRL